MIIFSPFNKQPWEEETIALEWSARLASGDSLSSGDIKCYDISDDSDVTSTLIDSTAISGTQLYLKVKGGDDGGVYKVEMKMTTSNGDKKEGEIFVIVKEE